MDASPEIAMASMRLPENIPADYADRLFAATDQHFGAMLVTDAQLLLKHGVAGYLKAMKAGP